VKSDSLPRNLARASAVLVAFALVAGCASKGPKGVPDVPECRAAAAKAPKLSFDVGTDYLERQADAYSECMAARGYVLDDEAVQSNLDRYETVQNSDVMRGDPGPLLAVRRQKLRMTPKFWRAATPPPS
jgi:hypothetical protein